MRKGWIAIAAMLLLSGCGANERALPMATHPLTVAAMQDDSAFPAVGHVYRVDFGGGHVFNLHFASMTRMTYSLADGPDRGAGETVAIAVTPIRPGVFMVTWQESDKTSVVHVEDYQNGVVYTNITPPDGSFIHWKGTLTPVR